MEIKKFKFNKTNQEVRSVVVENEAWFVAKDICDILELSDTNMVLSKLDDDEKLTQKIFGSGQNRNMWLINESGLYTLILRSNKPEAKSFRKWVTNEVLPSIRKHGAYMTPTTIDDMINNPDMAIQLLTTLKKEREEKERIKLELIEKEERVKILQPAKEFTDKYFKSNETTFSIGELAKILNIPNIGRNKLFEMLRESKIIQKDSTIPYQRYVDSKWFEVKMTEIKRSNGKIDKKPTAYVTNRGFGFIVKKLGLLESLQSEN